MVKINKTKITLYKNENNNKQIGPPRDREGVMRYHVLVTFFLFPESS